MRVCFLTEMGSRIGHGHVTRCLALAQAFEERGVGVCFVIYAEDQCGNIVGNREIKTEKWFADGRAKNLLAGCDVAVIDSYLAPEGVYKSAAQAVPCLLSFDDYKRLDYPAGIVLNAAADAEDMEYPDNRNVRYLIGEKYVPIRRPFWDVEKRRAREAVQNILVMFGGTDAQNLTAEVIRALNIEYPSAQKTAVLRRQSWDEKVYGPLKSSKTAFVHDCDAEAIKELMLEADMAVSAGGQTLYEFAATGLPAVSVAVAENQRGNTRGWQKKGLIEFAGFWSDAGLVEKVLGGVRKLQHRDVRQKMADAGQAHVDGQGARRIVKLILESVGKVNANG